MARKRNPDNLELPLDHREERHPHPVARNTERIARKRRGISMLRYSFALFTATCFVVGAVFAFQKTEQYLISDPYFALTGAGECGQESPNLTVEGVTYASRTQIVNVFAQDFDRSLYLFPAAQRRKRLLTVDWVKDASIAKIWPNRVLVNVAERRPVAFAELPPAKPGGAKQLALIDADGVILHPQKAARFELPILVGIRSEDSPAVRRNRVRRMLQLMQELGSLSDKVSEIDASEPENLRITEQADNRAMVLMVGDRNFAPKVRMYLSHSAEIRKQRPDATVLDMRVEDRITVVEGNRHE